MKLNSLNSQRMLKIINLLIGIEIPYDGTYVLGYLTYPLKNSDTNT